MAWKDVASKADEPMTTEQRNMIILLRERFDGVSMGTYAADQLPKWSKREASIQIDRLNKRIEAKGKK